LGSPFQTSFHAAIYWLTARPKLTWFFHKMLKLAQIGLGYDSPGTVHFGERSWLNGYLPKEGSSVVFDVGGHCGDFSAEVLKSQPNAKLFVFEPNPLVFRELEKRFLTESAHLFPYALSDRSGSATLYDLDIATLKQMNIENGSTIASLHEPLFTEFFKQGYRRIPIETTTVDEIIAKFSLERIDLLKIDAEGWELSVLKGAEKGIAAGKISAIQFEFGFRNVYSRALYGDYVHLLRGYRLHRLLAHGLLPLGEYDPRRDENLASLQTIVALRSD